MPSAPTSATRQLPPSQLRGHQRWGGGAPCLDRASPSSRRDGTHWDRNRVHCLLHPQIPGEAAQFSAHVRSTGFQKGMGNSALPTRPKEVLCLGFTLCDRYTHTGSDPSTSTLSWAGSPASSLILRWGSHKCPKPAAQALLGPWCAARPCHAHPSLQRQGCTLRAPRLMHGAW